MQKGFSVILILLGMLAISAGVIGGAYYFSTRKSETAPVISSPSTSPDQISELGDFPIYPEAIFVSKSREDKRDIYKFSINDSFANIDDFYKKQLIWKCSGGYGVADEMSGNIITLCNKGNLEYSLGINSIFDEQGVVPNKTTITISVPDASQQNEKCVVGGCSGQACVDANSPDVISTCEYREVYGCYKEAECKKQSDGKCGWTQTEELTQCIKEKSQTNSLQ